MTVIAGAWVKCVAVGDIYTITVHTASTGIWVHHINQSQLQTEIRTIKITNNIKIQASIINPIFSDR